MIAQPELLRAIQLVKAGEREPAAALLAQLVDDTELDKHSRAVASLWLAETSDDRHFKINCLRRALAFERHNTQVQQVLDQLLAEVSARPGQDSSQTTGTAIRLAQPPLVVGISGGSNGPGSGIFLDTRGTVATTSYVVGGAQKVAVDIDATQPLDSQVVRRYPDSDLALIKTPVALDQLDTIAPGGMILKDEPFMALGFGGSKLRGKLRDPGGSGVGGWLHTNIQPAMMPDAGGNPLIDGNGQAHGILTRNIDHASGCACAISMSQIMTLANQYWQEHILLPDAGYCACCGSRTRASVYGGVHCETCGARLADDAVLTLGTLDRGRLSQLFGENQSRACPNCEARAGFYGGCCLRCAHELAGASASA